MPLPQALGRFNKHATNKVVGVVAGHLPGMAMVLHRGRRSGTEYRTPVNVFGGAERYRFALTYGKDTDWVRNVLAAGECVVETRGHTVELDDPWIGHDPKVAWAPPVVRSLLRTLGVEYYLQCRVRHR
ncbi:nitroreductase family deazaflavin-dependent oxidoreductase [Aldersonia sp. NBC_00410]|jgi:deazaflavin-dependent oxidoreductase (nitroreductase family)|uniref:nitroreductase family deazaflavin-dependent oxidoreductase n=1 Tax=Aldersonia sp. NBC_00410 TaxID=2975954 RepID=UPI00225A7ACC|nr:nitroreductase family deazaflavin-dependent oxidoreductase [Aldersonia sp. NBC_00410]MCX5045834.1 nitroreductase family deazaflavin-dependent oxidoreductase [Aldersonia sp. NBC_00410]